MFQDFSVESLKNRNISKDISTISDRIKEISQSINFINNDKKIGLTGSFADLINISKLNGVVPNMPVEQTLSSTTENQVRLLNPNMLIELIQNNAKKYKVDPKLINAVIKNESGYNLNAKSQAGAIGLMQLMPGTSKDMGFDDPSDPAQNIEAGTKYLSKMLEKFNGNIVLALSAYNAGPGAVGKYNGIPPYKETQNYVMKVLDTYLSTNKTNQEMTNV